MAVLDFDLVQRVYSSFKDKVDKAKEVLGRPMTYAEKILYSHLSPEQELKAFARGEDYVYFAPDRIAMQDATAQMAILQFMLSGRDKVAVPTTVHADHLIKARYGVPKDLEIAKQENKETSSKQQPRNTEWASGNQAQVLFTRLFWKTMLSRE